MDRLGLDRLRLIYAVLVTAQIVTISLYELDRLPKEPAIVAGLATSLGGPLLSFVVSLDIFRHRRSSKILDIVSIITSYVVTCMSFAIMDFILSGIDASAFSQTIKVAGKQGLGAFVYFSIITITTTGYGDIVPVSGLARAAACWEIATGLLYQVFTFSLIASLIMTPTPPRGGEGS